MSKPATAIAGFLSICLLFHESGEFIASDMVRGEAVRHEVSVSSTSEAFAVHGFSSTLLLLRCFGMV